MVLPSLLDMSIKFLVDNIKKFDKEFVKNNIGPVRKEMLERMLKMVDNHGLTCDGQANHLEKMWEILPCLINSKSYTELDFGDLTTSKECESCIWSNNCFQEFIRCLGTNTPNLRQLIIVIPNFEWCDFEYSLEERELNSIIQLKNLAILDIEDVRVPLSGIFDICRRCEKLERIHAEAVIIDVELSSAAFGDDFAYICIKESDYSRQISLDMKRTVPTTDPKYEVNTHYVRLYLKPKRNKDLFLAQEFATKLREIQVDFSKLEGMEEMAGFPHLPQIKCARFVCGGKSAHALRCFLKRNGESLLELDLFDVDSKDKMTFGEIFTFCPNLKSLELFACTLVGNDAPVDAMQQLKRFKWRWLNRYVFDEVAFSSILSAPLLEDIYIDLPKIDFSDNATIIARIQRRDILRNLKKIEMDEMMIDIPFEENHSSYLTRFTDLKNAFASAISAGPL
ncbi:Hypothetical predicted protein [Cloeon dipterum]|nr:Hypothetical predicted protein [Cloeon dipterum]